ncbi:uncharacterized protein LOC117529976 [Thalassophryne amazonica]|uniref:uncharacterized protein LOC117529976 n=1 Tax=Thalassophryne amazonica TaxID=390379 RepID=UPI0014717E91|nr:uncharacterized protein LOC117529976 [Thalassophryne amazonica]
MTDGAAHRHFLLCPVCNRTQQALGVHLRRTCMKDATRETITAAVEKAKDDVFQLLKTGRVFTYDLLRGIIESRDPLGRLIEELQRRKMVVSDMPAAESPATQDPTAQAGPSTAVETGQSSTPEDTSEAASESSGETFQCSRTPAWKVNKRALMAEMGLYQKHSADHRLLRDFGAYLLKDLANENYKQEVDNVARFLFYMDPARPSLLFVRDRERTKEYLRKLAEAQLAKQTQVNYLKSLKRFLTYHTVCTNLLFDDRELHTDAKHFIEYIGALGTQLSKGISKEVVAKRDRLFRSDRGMTPQDCWAVLRAAKPDFLAVIAKIFEAAPCYAIQLETSECLLVLYYLEAVVILKHLQRPGVVEHMTVEEWKNRIQVERGHTAIAVKEHKTAAQQVASFVLSPEEETWFMYYFDVVRDAMKSSKRYRMGPDAEKVEENPQERFFLSTAGMPVYNASNDLARLHKKYNVPVVTSQLARRVFETAAKKLTDVDKSLVADYLTHSTATAEKHYRMKQGASLMKGSQLISALGSDLSGESGDDAAGTSGKSQHIQMDFQVIWDKFVEEFPVTVDGTVPSLSSRCAASVDHQRKIYERWLKSQMKLRVQHVISHFDRRLPSRSRVAAWIDSQGWRSNVPVADYVLEAWKPSSSIEDMPSSKCIRRLVSNQKWKGLALKDIQGKGKGVVAARKFVSGEVVCDYHGRVVTGAEGEEIHATTKEEQTGYMFFYSKDGQRMCLDAHAATCSCHPDRQTFGRMINHSRKKANVRPRLFSLDFDGNTRDVMLFLAMRDIKKDEEILFDYGVKRHSFCGEGLDLDWI